MKKLLTVLLSVMMLFALAGCKSDDKQEETAPADENPAAEVETAPDEPIMGGWIDIEDGTLSNELENIFNTALEGLMGAKYEPVKLLATQVVNGTNYRFLANGTKTTNPITIGTYNVTVNVSSDGTISLVDIEAIEEKQEEQVEKKQDVTEMYFWVVFYDENDNELQREALLYGSTPSYKSELPDDFVKWTYKKTGEDVDVFVPITTNTYFKAVCEHVSHLHWVYPASTCQYNGSDHLYYIYSVSFDLSDDYYHVYDFIYKDGKYVPNLDNGFRSIVRESAIGTHEIGDWVHADKEGNEVGACDNNGDSADKSVMTICSITGDDDNYLVLLGTADGTSSSYVGSTIYTYDPSSGAWIRNGSEDVPFGNVDFGDVPPESMNFDDYAGHYAHAHKMVASTTYELCNLDHKIEDIACLAEGTMITMADGSRKAVETLSQGDLIKAFDHNTGKMTTAKIMDYWQYDELKGGLITLHFSNNVDIRIVDAHAFYCREENNYVCLDKHNVDEYIGKHFYNADNATWVVLESATLSDEKVKTFYLATEKHFNCVAEGMLNVEDGVYYVINSAFEYDDNMRINKLQKLLDIARYGLFKYSEFDYMTKEEFDIHKIAYLKIVLGKGMITEDDLQLLEVLYSSDEYN